MVSSAASSRRVEPVVLRRPLLAFESLSVTVATPTGRVAAVRGVDLEIGAGEIVGLVGESGCGKSLTCLAAMRLLPPGARAQGRLAFLGRDLLTIGEPEMVAMRGREIAMIGQDPGPALNPIQTIGRQLVEALSLDDDRARGRGACRDAAERLLAEVGMPDPRRRLDAYPHQLSGGQCQRVMIAMMLARRPKLLLADEPTTALDVTVQAQILRLLRRLRQEHGMALLMVTHDLGVVAELCDRVAIMYGGRIVESGPVRAVFTGPQHPYTAGLLASRARMDRRRGRLETIGGNVPTPRDLPAGCSFWPRCPHAAAACRAELPAWRPTKQGGVACVHPLAPEAFRR